MVFTQFCICKFKYSAFASANCCAVFTEIILGLSVVEIRAPIPVLLIVFLKKYLQFL